MSEVSEAAGCRLLCSAVWAPVHPPRIHDITRQGAAEIAEYFCYDAAAMATLSYRTAGESHGKAMLALVEGMPAGVPVDKDFIDHELRRRQGGYGRGGRQKIESDKVEFL